MNIFPKTLLGQFVVASALVVFLSLSLLFVGLSLILDQRFRGAVAFEIFSDIAHTYSLTENLTQEERQNALKYAQSADVYYEISDNSEGQPVESVERFNSVSRQFLKDDIVVFSKIDETEKKLFFQYWFGDQPITCEDYRITTEDFTSCPQVSLYLKYKDGTWLKAKSFLSPGSTILALPAMVIILVVTLCVVFVIMLIARRITLPLENLARSAEKIGKGQSIENLPLEGPLEVTTTASAFIQMQSRITRYVEDRVKMIASISHDLRTPITALRIRSELIEEKELKDAIISNVEELQMMVESCLTFSRQEAAPEPRGTVDLINMLQDLADERTEARFENSELDSFEYECQPVSLKRAFRNLSDNAILYGEDVTYQFSRDNDLVEITFWDQGEGISQADQERIFAPFVRLDEARLVGEGNVGLGLAIARGIIRKHGGDIIPTTHQGRFGMQVQLPA